MPSEGGGLSSAAAKALVCSRRWRGCVERGMDSLYDERKSEDVYDGLVSSRDQGGGPFDANMASPKEREGVGESEGRLPHRQR